MSGHFVVARDVKSGRPMRPVLLVAAALLVNACSGSSATIDPPSGTSSSSGGTGTGTAPTAPPESAFRGTTGGCGNVIVYRANGDGTQLLVVKADKDKLGLEPLATQTFDLARAPDGLDVGVEVFAKAPPEPPYCTDVGFTGAAPTRWTAEGGTISISLAPEGSATAGPYRATVRLKDVRLVGPERGVAVSIPSAEIANVLVGWLAG
jgi:hypothetical protein